MPNHTIEDLKKLYFNSDKTLGFGNWFVQMYGEYIQNARRKEYIQESKNFKQAANRIVELGYATNG